MCEGNGIDHRFAMVAFIDINGARLAYTVSDNDATKPLLITLHGGRGFGK
jgi:proline iminopeptidase